MKIFSFYFLIVSFGAVLIFPSWVTAQQPADNAANPAADQGKPAQEKKAKDAKSAPEKPLAFWAKELPKVSGKIEQYYDINRDGIMQTYETKIFLRDVQKEINDKKSYNVSDSAILKAYDKNKDGIISALELEDIKKDLVY